MRTSIKSAQRPCSTPHHTLRQHRRHMATNGKKYWRKMTKSLLIAVCQNSCVCVCSCGLGASHQPNLAKWSFSISIVRYPHINTLPIHDAWENIAWQRNCVRVRLWWMCFCCGTAAVQDNWTIYASGGVAGSPNSKYYGHPVKALHTTF